MASQTHRLPNDSSDGDWAEPEKQPNPQHFKSITDQLIRLGEVMTALGTPPPPPFDDPTAFVSTLYPTP